MRRKRSKREKERKRGAPISARSFAFDRAFLSLGAIARAVSCAKNPPLSWKTLSIRQVPEIRSRGASLARFLGALRTLCYVFLCALRASLNEVNRGKFASFVSARKGKHDDDGKDDDEFFSSLPREKGL